MSDDPGSLIEQTESFAKELTETVRAVAPTAAVFEISTVPGRVVVRQSPETGITLTVGDQPLLVLKVEFDCCWDSSSRFLAIERSSIRVSSPGVGDPLFRVEYLRQPGSSNVARAHLHVHGHRDAITFAMARAGRGSTKGKTRSRSRLVPRLSELHFPLGGHRFRPCLEDVLTMLIEELGVDHPDGALRHLAEGRARWRRQQLRAATRDSPSHAADVLRALGYTVTPPDPEPPERLDRLQEL